MSSQNYNYAVGRRKTATAVVKLSANGKGKFSVTSANGKVQSLYNYFGGNKYLLDAALSPFYAIDKNFHKKYDAEITVRGGGKGGHADAIKLGFARGLIQSGTDFRSTLKPLGLLERDDRKKERKKPGLKKARKAPTRSKR